MAKYYRPCHSVFACNGPYASQVGAEGLAKQNLERARQLVKESGYDGRPVTVVHVTDLAHLNGAALVTRRDESDRRVGERVDDVEVLLARQAEHILDALVLEARNEELRDVALRLGCHARKPTLARQDGRR